MLLHQYWFIFFFVNKNALIYYGVFFKKKSKKCTREIVGRTFPTVKRIQRGCDQKMDPAAAADLFFDCSFLSR